MSVFRELLSIKAFRENKAESAVRAQRLVLAQAHAAQEQARQLLEAFRHSATQREREAYADLCRRIVRLRDIEDVQQFVALLRNEELAHAGALAKASQYSEQQAKELEQRKQAHVVASRMKQKFVELAQIYADEQIREIERKEDAELEEAAETRKDRADWDEREALEEPTP